MGRFIVVLLVLLAGCTTTTDIAIKDNSVFLPSARMSIDISPEVRNPSVPHTGHALELGASGGRGEDRQELASGQDPVIFGGRTFNAPVTLDHEFKFHFLEAAYRFRKFFAKSQKFGLEALVGIAHAELDLTVSSPGLRAREEVDSTGLVGGFGLIWKFRPTTSIQSRVSVFGSGDEGGVSAARRVDLYVAQALGNHAALRAGFSNWLVESDREYGSRTVNTTTPLARRSARGSRASRWGWM
jgi:hypothetical protein